MLFGRGIAMLSRAVGNRPARVLGAAAVTLMVAAPAPAGARVAIHWMQGYRAPGTPLATTVSA